MLSAMSEFDHDYTPYSVTSSQCLGAPHQFGRISVGLGLCQARQPCNNAKAACIESRGNPVNQLPGYFWCELAVNQ
jgi:hypothetical protein